MLYALTVVAASVLAVADEKDPLVGSWTVVSTKMAERDNPDPNDKGAVFTFKDGKVTIKAQNGEHTVTYKLDTSKKPATIDWVPDDGETKGQTFKGIFAVNKGELKLCFAPSPDKDRPKELSSNKGEETMLLVLKKK